LTLSFPLIVAVGQHEIAEPLVTGTHVRSSKRTGLAAVPCRLESVEDSVKSAACPADVLPEHEGDFGLDGDSESLEEESAAFPVEACPLSGEAEVLTRASESEAIQDATPGAAIEGADIRPNRSGSQAALFHARRQDGAGKCFPLHMNDCASASNDSLNPESEAASTGKELRNVEGVTHTLSPVAL